MRCFLLLGFVFIRLAGFCQSDMSNILAKDNENQNQGDKDGVYAVMRIQKVADSLFFGRNYNKSISLFKRIVRLNPENRYAKAKIEEINLLLINLEKPAKDTVIKKNSTSEIISRAKNIQEKRIEMNRNYYANKNAP